MTTSGSSSPPPNVVPPPAAQRIRCFVFEKRDRSVFSPSEAVELLIEAGHGEPFDEDVRRARLLTWVKQVFRRLRKKGWLRARSDAEWLPAAALRHCPNVETLARTAPVDLRRPADTVPAGKSGRSARDESWPDFVERWVFDHRKAPFAVGDLVADMLRSGFGRGDPRQRLEDAREVAEHELLLLEREILLDRDGEVWRPTEILREWPSA